MPPARVKGNPADAQVCMNAAAKLEELYRTPGLTADMFPQRPVALRAARRLPGSRSSSDTAAPNATRQRRSSVSRSVPTIAAGTNGTPAASATRAAPVCGRGERVLRNPFSRRVPSGKIPTG